MTQAQAIERGFTHFIEVWRMRGDKQGYNEGENEVCKIEYFADYLATTRDSHNLYTVAIFLCKLKPKQ